MNHELPFTPDLEMRPDVVPFFDEDTNTFSYVVKDPTSNACAVVDSVMNFHYPSAHLSFEGADRIINHIKQHDLDAQWIIETHVHADHFSAAPYIQDHVGGKLAIGDKITVVQETFGKIFNEGTEFARDGSQFDELFADGSHYKIGNLNCYALFTPGHTPACMTHIIGDAIFVGDTLFMPDAGTARADFPGGDARTLFQSTRRILQLPDSMRMFMCHDYQPNDRELEYETSVEEQRRHNIHVKDSVSEDEFVTMREKRDATLEVPNLILPSLQVNMRAGHLPPADADRRVFLKIPIDAFD